MIFTPRFTIKSQNIEFTVAPMDRNRSEYKLLSISHSGPAQDAFIPHELPSGEKITLITSCFCIGEYRKITIDDRISAIQEDAFFEADVEEIVWPASCRRIPACCFSCSTVSKISNIDNVCTVEERGFSRIHGLIDIKWPSACDTIPYGCFYSSTLKSVTNLDHVASIETEAFFDAKLINPLDLSQALSVDLAYRAFCHLTPEQVIPPYYMQSSMFDKAFEKI